MPPVDGNGVLAPDPGPSTGSADRSDACSHCVGAESIELSRSEIADRLGIDNRLPAALPIPGTLCHNPRPTTCRGALASRAVGAASDEMACSDVSP